jgi:hypothetical protein
MNVPELARKAGTAISRNAPVICTATGIVTVVSIPFLTGKATIKATKLLEKRKEQLDVEVLEPKEIVKTTWKVYIPVGTATIFAIAMFIAAHKTNSVQKAALASAYSIAETTLKKYQEKVVEVIGEDKEKEVRDEVAQEVIKETYSEEIIPFGEGEHLCYDKISGRYFRSDVESIREAMNDFNSYLNTELYQDLNCWYLCLNLPEIQLGYLLGWNVDKLMDIQFSSAIAPNGEPCIVLDYYSSLPSPAYRC